VQISNRTTSFSLACDTGKAHTRDSKIVPQACEGEVQMQDIDLRPYLRAHHLTTRQLKRLLRVSESTVVRWKRQGVRSRLDFLLLCAYLVQKSPADLFHFLHDVPRHPPCSLMRKQEDALE
jgi:hypothetical protein